VQTIFPKSENYEKNTDKFIKKLKILDDVLAIFFKKQKITKNILTNVSKIEKKSEIHADKFFKKLKITKNIASNFCKNYKFWKLSASYIKK